MIGVIADRADHEVVREFFELFKTPWEFYSSQQQYDVLLCTSGADFNENAAKLVVVYSGQRRPADGQNGCDLYFNGNRIPIYRGCVTFGAAASNFLLEPGSGLAAIDFDQRGQTKIARIGYDLFAEIRTLLTSGQPAANAGVPTLELHIDLLRELMVTSGISVTEIPPVPAGYRFIACLTHDVDHPLIRNHGLDHTTIGFLYRATVGSILSVFRGRRPVREALRNLAAAARLPFVYLGAANDFWSEFDCYVQYETGIRSSFFVIPFRGRPGRRESGQAPARRAARYGVSDVAEQIHRLASAGCEIGAHGIDAWCDSSAGRAELEEVRRIAGVKEIGIRMHWLYFNQQSPEILEAAGADYDSTVGYNETVGYRAGTTQVYKPLRTTRLLELPLHIMDTALFYPAYLDLSPNEAIERVEEIIDDAVRYGGCVTVNWHDRSIAPERCWGSVYADLIEALRKRGAWFGTAAETVAWFRKRRSARFENCEGDAVRLAVRPAEAGGTSSDGLPELSLKVTAGRDEQTLCCHV
jgi:peptidoglycan/xylan/chitin deacetylase (PgdA/CDA1 family)